LNPTPDCNCKQLTKETISTERKNQKTENQLKKTWSW